MASNQRPGGLTALAVINFVWGGFTLLGSLALIALIPFLGMVLEQAREDMPPEQLAQLEAMADVSGPLLMVAILSGVVTAALLIASGVGYLKLKKFLGRTLGNAFAVVSIVTSVVSAMMFPVAIGGGFGIGAIIGLIYPVLTLFLLNVTFKEDFVN